MKKNVFKRYNERIKTGVYEIAPEIEQIITDITEYNENSLFEHENIQFTFREYCPDPDKRICIKFITTNEIDGLHCHDFYEFNYVFEGRLLQYIDGKSFLMQSGDLLFLHPTVFHSLYSYHDARAVNILIHKDYLERFCSNVGVRVAHSFLNRLMTERAYIKFSPMKELDNIRPLVAEMCALSNLPKIAKKLLGVPCSESDEKLDTLIIEQLLRQVILQIIKGVENGAIVEKASNPLHTSSDATQIVEFIRENYRDVSINDVSRKFGYSSAQIYRIVKKLTGSNFNTVIMTLRVIRSKYLLTNTDIPISQIAGMVGLASSEYFFRLFKEQVGCTPLQYRKLQRMHAIPPNDAITPEVLLKLQKQP